MAGPSIYRVDFREVVFSGSVGSMQEPSGLVAVAEIDGVRFRWDYAYIIPYYYQIRYQVETDGWGNWINLGGAVTDFRGLTLAEKNAHNTGVNLANIQAQLRITDGAGHYSVATLSANADALRGNILSGDIVDGNITTAKVADAGITADKILNSAVTGSKILPGTITGPKLQDGTVGTTQLSNDSVDGYKLANLAVSEGKIANLAVTAGKLAANAVETAKIKDLNVTNAKIEAGSGTTGIQVAKLHTDTTARMFESAGRAKLDAVLPVTINNLDATDKILISGVHDNIGTNKAAIKTSLLLNLVENLTAENQCSAGITSAITTAKQLVLYTNILAKINASAEATKIQETAIDKVLGVQVYNSAKTLALFNAAGNVITGIESGAVVLTPAMIHRAMTVTGGGRSRKLDLADIDNGNLDNINDGATYGKTTLAQAIAAGYAVAGLHTTGANKVGSYYSVSGLTKTPLQIENRCDARRIVWAEQKTGTGTFDFDVITYAPGAPGWETQRVIRLIFQKGDATVYYKTLAKSDLWTGKIRILVYDDAGSLIVTGTGTTLNNAAYNPFEASADIGTAGFVEHDIYDIAIQLYAEGPAEDSFMKGGVASVSV
ncbi:MAG: hypothetical protein EHM79_00355 [Geobacter sp.]|nr:MAG: hypothetical protein EHM79_00355 [Geobacter sp.]